LRLKRWRNKENILMSNYITLYKTKCIEIGIFSLKKINRYSFNSDIGENVIFRELTPVAYFTYQADECGRHVQDLVKVCRINNVDVFSFFNNFLEYTTNKELSLRPCKKGKLLIGLKTTNNSKNFKLPYYNIDEDWETLSEAGIQKLVKMSKSTLNME